MVPVLSNTMVSATATDSRNLPPLMDMLWLLPSLIAESTAIGIESFSAHEKSTMSTASALVTLRVSRYTSPVAPRVYGTSLSARCEALSSAVDFSFSDSSIILTIRSYRPLPNPLSAQTMHSPSSTTVPAYTYPPYSLCTGRLSPVIDAWFTVISPEITLPSRGIILPVLTMNSSPICIWLTGTSTSLPSAVFFHTLSTLRDMAPARSATDFLRVQSSIISPILRRNIMDEAVPKSPLMRDTAIAVASSTGTSILLSARHLSPDLIYLTDLYMAISFLNGIGTISLFTIRLAIQKNSLSSNSLFSALDV